LENTIPRQQLLELMEQFGPPGTGAFISEVMSSLYMSEQNDFTKADFVRVMQEVANVGKERISAEDGAPGASPEQKAHMISLLDSLNRHAFPLLVDGPVEFPNTPE
jgi:hypothetical protein